MLALTVLLEWPEGYTRLTIPNPDFPPNQIIHLGLLWRSPF
jgi:hypothetical protein